MGLFENGYTGFVITGLEHDPSVGVRDCRVARAKLVGLLRQIDCPLVPIFVIDPGQVI